MTKPYVPLQIPYLLNRTFHKYFDYHETHIDSLQSFVICMWSIRGKKNSEFKTMHNVILPDGCIDLIIAFTDQRFGFSGTSKTEFDFEDDTEKYYFGFRMLPGVFHTLTQTDASHAMDQWVDASKFIELPHDFWSLSFEQAQLEMISILEQSFESLKPSEFTTLFLGLNASTPLSADDVASKIGYSTKQCNRLFIQNFGITAKHMLSVIRLQKALNILYENKETALSSLAIQLGYYDQSHFTNDLTQNLRLTPTQLISLFHQ